MASRQTCLWVPDCPETADSGSKFCHESAQMINMIHLLAIYLVSRPGGGFVGAFWRHIGLFLPPRKHPRGSVSVPHRPHGHPRALSIVIFTYLCASCMIYVPLNRCTCLLYARADQPLASTFHPLPAHETRRPMQYIHNSTVVTALRGCIWL